MLKKQFESYFAKQVKTAELNLKITSLGGDKEALHDLRVSIKKLRLIARLADKLIPRPKLRKFYRNRIKPVFRVSGDLRNSKIQLQLIKEFEMDYKANLQSLIEYILKNQLKNSVQLSKLINKAGEKVFEDFHKEALLKTKKVETAEFQKTVFEYMQKTIKKLIRNSKNYNVNGLHKQRKLIKEFKFCLEIVYQKKSNPECELLFLKIKSAEDLLGAWHDLHDFKMVIREFLSKERKKMKKFLPDINKISEEVTGKIIDYLDEYLKYAEGFIGSMQNNPLFRFKEIR